MASLKKKEDNVLRTIKANNFRLSDNYGNNRVNFSKTMQNFSMKSISKAQSANLSKERPTPKNQ